MSSAIVVEALFLVTTWSLKRVLRALGFGASRGEHAQH